MREAGGCGDGPGRRPRPLLLSGTLDHDTVGQAVAALLAYRAEQPLRVVVSAAHGDPFGALTLCGVMGTLDGRVSTLGLGELGLAGLLVLASGTPGHRSILPSARLHPRYGPPAHDVSVPCPHEQLWQREAVLAQLSSLTRLPRAELELLLAGSLVVDAHDAVAWGLADHVVERS